MLIVARLTVRRDELELFRWYEHAAARVMARYGGAIEHAYVIDDKRPEPDFDDAATLDRDAATTLDLEIDTIHEIHVVRFPNAAAFDAYKADPEITALAGARDRAVLATEIWPASDGPRYGQPPHGSLPAGRG